MTSVEYPPHLAEIIESAERLPPFPDVVWKVAPLIRKMAPLQEIEAVVKYDQVIAAKVLAMSQSPLYARKRGISSLQDAIVALGDQQLLVVILTACSARYFTDDASGYDLRSGELWDHAIAAGLMSEIVARHFGFKNTLTAYTAGLLHDIGKTVLNFHVKTYFESIMDAVKEQNISFIEAEQRILGIDHEQLGALIARRWRFPADVTAAIGNHHRPLEAGEHTDLAGLVYVVNRMVSAMGIGCGADGFLQPNHDKVFVSLGINAQLADKFLVELMERYDQAREFLKAS
ncbi:MAG: HDOD domain-containing protein [Syntrophobacteraceae bacterium]|nr:HDOD domain-containing protein [Syntrophobacteraceae bacterium]